MFKSQCKGPISEMVQDTMSSSSGGHFYQSCYVSKRPVSASADINADKLAEFFVEKVEEVRSLLPSAMCRRRRRMFAMMHLCNFRQVSIDEVRQMMTRSPVKVPLSTETVKGVS